jgi:hypothetical protein
MATMLITVPAVFGVLCLGAALFVFRYRNERESSGFKRSLIILMLCLMLFAGTIRASFASVLDLSS